MLRKRKPLGLVLSELIVVKEATALLMQGKMEGIRDRERT